MSAQQTQRLLHDLALALGGDRAAERRTALLLIDIIEPLVTRTILREASPYLPKKEIVHEVLLHLREDNWKRLRKYDPVQRPFAAWAYRVMLHLVRDIVHRWQAQDNRKVEARPPDSGPGDKLWRAAAISRLASSLRPSDFVLLQWTYLQDVPRDEVAARLGIDPQAANARIRRALANARALLS